MTYREIFEHARQGVEAEKEFLRVAARSEEQRLIVVGRIYAFRQTMALLSPFLERGKETCGTCEYWHGGIYVAEDEDGAEVIHAACGRLPLQGEASDRTPEDATCPRHKRRERRKGKRDRRVPEKKKSEVPASGIIWACNATDCNAITNTGAGWATSVCYTLAGPITHRFCPRCLVRHEPQPPTWACEGCRWHRPAKPEVPGLPTHCQKEGRPFECVKSGEPCEHREPKDGEALVVCCICPITASGTCESCKRPYCSVHLSGEPPWCGGCLSEASS